MDTTDIAKIITRLGDERTRIGHRLEQLEDMQRHAAVMPRGWKDEYAALTEADDHLRRARMTLRRVAKITENR